MPQQTSWTDKLKAFVTSPAFIHGLLIAAHIAVAVAVKNPGAVTIANEALGAADAFDPMSGK